MECVIPILILFVVDPTQAASHRFFLALAAGQVGKQVADEGGACGCIPPLCQGRAAVRCCAAGDALGLRQMFRVGEVRNRACRTGAASTARTQGAGWSMLLLGPCSRGTTPATPCVAMA